MDITSYLLGKKAGGGGGGGDQPQTFLIKDMESGTDVSGMKFILDISKYTSEQLTDGIDDLNGPAGFEKNDHTDQYFIGFTPGDVVSAIAQEVSAKVYKPDGTSFGEIDNTHIYAVYGYMNLTTEIPDPIYMLADLTTKESYGNMSSIPSGYSLNYDVSVLPNSVLWNCMKLQEPVVNEYFASEITTTSNSNVIEKAIKVLPPLKINSLVRFEVFTGCSNLEKVEELNMPSVRFMDNTFYNCTNLKEINLITTSSLTSMQKTFEYCSELETLPFFNTSGVTTFKEFCAYCIKLKNVPQLDFSSATILSSAFQNCSNLTDESLNNILGSCISATSYTGTKTLNYLGLTKSIIGENARVEALPNYQAFVNAGWTIGN